MAIKGLSIFLMVFIVGMIAAHPNRLLADKMKSPSKFGSETEKKTDKITEAAVEKGYLSMMGKDALLSLLWAWQNTISRVDGKNCPLYPSCSHFGQESVRKHGPFIGYFMTGARYLHEPSAIEENTPILIDGQWLVSDPVSYNDFWWYDPLKDKKKKPRK